MRLHLTCGHVLNDNKDHGWVGSDGQIIYDSQKCLDTAEGRKPQKFGKDEDRPDQGGKTWARQ